MISKKKLIQTSILISLGTLGISEANLAHAADMSRGADNFYQSEMVISEEVRFTNAYGFEVVGTLFKPTAMNPNKKYSALVVGHPFAAVRQQSANLYATKMAEAGFVTLSFDQSFWGQSSGSPRGAVLPDLYTENFSAAVDFLGTRSYIDRNKIGVIGICGSGGFSIAATKIDPRIKALATVSMYDMGEYFRTGLDHERTVEMRNNDLALAADQRYTAFETGEPVYGPGQNDPIFIEAKESNDFYKTERGNVPSNDRRTTPATYAKFMNFHPFIDIETISPRPILFIAGEIAPSRTYTDTAFEMAAEPKEFFEVKGANRIDLYDRTEMIPWKKLTSFFESNL